MIRRLTGLSVTDFRLFRGSHHVTLNGNVVLVYGANGAGKSSFLSAIEFALLGKVPDLSHFTKDYPRCLRHVRASGGATAQVTFEEEGSGEPRVLTGVIQADNTIVHREQLNASAQRFFSDRCYLSQVKLGRLLDLYQTVEKGSTEAPIVQFVKRLLSLDSLDNLSNALHDIEDVRRLRKAFTCVSDFEESERRLSLRKSSLSSEIRSAADARSIAAGQIQQLVVRFDDQLRIDEMDLPGLLLLVDKVSQTVDSLKSGALTLLEKDAQTLRELKALLAPSEPSDDEQILQLEAILASNEGQLQRLSDELNGTLYAVNLSLANATVSFRTDEAELLSHRWFKAETAISTLLEQSNVERIGREQSEKQLEALTQQKSEKDTELERIQAEIAVLSAAVPGWAETLANLASQITGDECPVCLRDFSEASTVSLRDFVKTRASQIGSDASKLQNSEKMRAALRLEISDLESRLEAMKGRIAALPPVNVGETKEGLLSILKSLDRARPRLEQWIDTSNVIAHVRIKLDLSRARRTQLTQAREKIGEIAQRFSSDALLTAPLAEAVEELELRCAKEIDSNLRAIGDARTLADRLRDLTELIKKGNELDSQWLELDKEESQAIAARTRVDEVVSKAKAVLKCTVSAKRKLLDSVFNETLNHLWADLFDRIVRNEIFRPHLSESGATRDIIRATMQAVAVGIEPFSNVGAVHSLGNQNTSALSLFLSLNLIEPPQSRVLILDDPVQSMDDVHVSQLAALLRELVNQADRQIIVAVHERALFEFLAFELAPALEGRNLITVELERNADGYGTTPIVQVKEWAPDPQSFEFASSGRQAS